MCTPQPSPGIHVCPSYRIELREDQRVRNGSGSGLENVPEMGFEIRRVNDGEAASISKGNVDMVRHNSSRQASERIPEDVSPSDKFCGRGIQLLSRPVSGARSRYLSLFMNFVILDDLFSFLIKRKIK